VTARPAGSASFAERFRWGVRLTLQGLRRHRAAFFVSAAGFACAVAALAVCLALGRATGPATAATGTAQLVAFLDDASPAAECDALAAALGQLPGVAGVRVLPSDEALGRMRAELGTRAALLDGVEDGFLPTTLEIALRPGPQGAGRADELAWRLRRMAGISDVDVLRNEADHRLVTEQETSRRLRFTLLAIGGLLALAALMFVAAVGRRRRADALILDGLGFTPLAVYGPAFAGGALAAAAGTALALLGLRLLERLAPVLSSVAPIFALPHGLPTGRAQAAAFVVATSFGGALAWWGMRLPRRSSRGDGLAPGP